MKTDEILKKGKLKLTQFSEAEKAWMEERTAESGGKYHAECLMRHKKRCGRDRTKGRTRAAGAGMAA